MGKSAILILVIIMAAAIYASSPHPPAPYQTSGTSNNLLSGAQVAGGQDTAYTYACVCPLAGLAADTGGTISVNACDGGHGSQPPGTAEACGKGSCTLILPQTNPELGSDTINAACKWERPNICGCAHVTLPSNAPYVVSCEKKYSQQCAKSFCQGFPKDGRKSFYLKDRAGQRISCEAVS